MVPRPLIILATVCACVLAVSLGACGGTSKERSTAAARNLPLTPVEVGSPIPAGRMPVAVAVGAGSVWVADGGRGTLLRINPERRRRTGAAIAVGAAPFAVAVGEGAVWVAGTSGEIRAVDPDSMTTVGSPVRVAGANGLAVGLDGVWVTSRIAGTLTRIDPRTRRAGPPIRVGAGPADVVIADGAVWVANAADGTVSRVDPGTRRADPPIRVGGELLALAAGEGALWAGRARGQFAERVEVVRLDPRARRLTGRAVAVQGAIPLDLAAGGGSVWVTDVGGFRPPQPRRPGSLTRIAPGGPAVVGDQLKTGERPTAVAVGAGGVWVANAADGTVTPVAASR